MKHHPMRHMAVAVLVMILAVAVTAEDGPDSRQAVYVWGFSDPFGMDSSGDLARSLTEYFEEALINVDTVTILERRNYARLFRQEQGERAIMNIQAILPADIDHLDRLMADIVIFGEVYEDESAGTINISVIFQELFSRRLLMKKSTTMILGKKHDPESKKKVMQDLIADIYPPAEPMPSTDTAALEEVLRGYQRMMEKFPPPPPKPSMPIEVKIRRSMAGITAWLVINKMIEEDPSLGDKIGTYDASDVGYVVKFKNQIGYAISARVVFNSPSAAENKELYLTLAPYEEKEIGWKEGWHAKPGDELTIINDSFKTAYLAISTDRPRILVREGPSAR
jgi:hypothetical protein